LYIYVFSINGRGYKSLYFQFMVEYNKYFV
jgi:hypothetical protein